jgi:hypothetical protein
MQTPFTQGKTQEPNLHQCKLTTLKVVSVDEMKWR